MDNVIFEPRKKRINKYNKQKYYYFGLLGIFLLVGVSYAIIFFMEQYKSDDLGALTNLLDISISENGRIAIDNAKAQKDSDGLKNTKTVFDIANNNAVPIKVILKLVPDEGSTIDTSKVRFGVIQEGRKLNIGYLSEHNNILYEFYMEAFQRVSLSTTIWLDYFFEGGSESVAFSGKYAIETSNVDEFAYAYLSGLVGKNKGLYAINEDGTLNSGTGTIKEYRYSGSNPDNYVSFNGELWRIVSLENGMVKIVRNDVIAKSSYLGNDNYYESINSQFKDYVTKGKFNTGGVNLTDTISTLLTNESSSSEKSYIGYLSASDYLYSTSTTYYTSALNSSNVSSNTWLTGTYLTNNGIKDTSNILGINANIPTSTTTSDTSYNIKPCLYLAKSVSIIGGNGTETNPYVLGYTKTIKTLVENHMNTFPTAITDEKANIAQVNFLDISYDEIEELGVTTYDLTYNNKGRVTGWFETDPTDSTKKILNVGSEGLTYLTTGSYLFHYWSSLKTIEFNNIDTSNVTDMSYMFEDDWGNYDNKALLEIDLSSFDTSNVTNMDNMFHNRKITSLDLSMWNVSSLTTMKYMFYYCTYLENVNLSGWNLESINNLSYSYDNTGDVYAMFHRCEGLKRCNLSDWQLPNVDNLDRFMYEAFGYNDEFLELDLSNWYIPNVTSMYRCFASDSPVYMPKTLIVSGWDTSSVTNMSYAFYASNAPERLEEIIGLNDWDTSSVTNMSWMFAYNDGLSILDLRSWDVSNATDMSYMFYYYDALTTIYANTNWQTVAKGLTNSAYMFTDCTNLVGAVAYNSSNVDVAMANPDTGYFTRKN